METVAFKLRNISDAIALSHGNLRLTRKLPYTSVSLPAKARAMYARQSPLILARGQQHRNSLVILSLGLVWLSRGREAKRRDVDMSEAPRYEMYSAGETYSIIYKVLGRRKRGEKRGSDRSASWRGREGDYELPEYARAPLSGRVASLDDHAEVRKKSNGVVAAWAAGRGGIPGKVDQSANNSTRRRGQRASSNVCGM